MTDTISPFEGSKPTILVDWELISSFPRNELGDRIIFWLTRVRAEFNLVLLVSYPDYNDFVPSERSLPELPEFDAVIRNTGRKREVDFKLNALGILRDVSISRPVVALEGNYSARQSFMVEGLVTLSESDVK